MAADEFVYGTKSYWLCMAEKCYYWHLEEPRERWEQFMYFYLFKWRGCDD